jgi:thymidylate synthase (FAD)
MYDSADPKFRAVLDHGFVFLVDTMGNDAAITQSARISYGTGTKSVREDRGLIRYLFRHHHTSPIEQCEVKFHIRLPIFVMRQLVRHRTSSLNEYSARYSEMSDEFYVPDASFIQPQSSDNKQGRDGDMSETSVAGVQWMMETIGAQAYDAYRVLLGDRVGHDEKYPNELLYDPYSESDPLLDAEFPGIARELARAVLPVSYYTEVYWKQNLHNLFHMLKLRTDNHAQHEIRVFAEAMYDLIKPLFPLACEAWEDYMRDAVTLSRMEKNLLRDLLSGKTTMASVDLAQYGLSKREFNEFVGHFSLAK